MDNFDTDVKLTVVLLGGWMDALIDADLAQDEEDRRHSKPTVGQYCWG